MSKDETVERISPELIAQLNKLASYLTDQGEWEAVDLIDTVVARATAMPSRELLREALEALTPFAIFGEIITFDSAMTAHPDDTPATILLFSDGVRRTLTFGDLRRARAAADKIRAALTEQVS